MTVAFKTPLSFQTLKAAGEKPINLSPHLPAAGRAAAAQPGEVEGRVQGGTGQGAASFPCPPPRLPFLPPAAAQPTAARQRPRAREAPPPPPPRPPACAEPRGCRARVPLTARASPRAGRGAAAARGPCRRGAPGAGPRPPPAQMPLIAARPGSQRDRRGLGWRRVCALPAGSAPPGGWRERVARAVPGPAARPPPAAGARAGLCAPCRPRALRGGGSKAAVGWQRLRGGPRGRSFPNYTRDNARGKKASRSGLRVGGREGAGSAGAERLGDPAGSLR